VPLREGVLYRIDTRLRPSGSQGTLVISKAALAAYHRRQGALWERQALLRARHVAGDAAVAEATLREVIDPAVFLPGEDPRRLAEEIAAMRFRLERETSGEAEGERNPKTGYGGLVDIEFLAQYLQLAHAAVDPALRHRSTPRTLRAMAAAGLLPEGDAVWLEEAYRFLRRLELRLQIVHDRPVGMLPKRAFDLGRLARRMGFAGPRAGASLQAEYARITGGVRETFRKVLAIA
jgi:glutamate-ammonia-ligase adenylyltransferase